MGSLISRLPGKTTLALCIVATLLLGAGFATWRSTRSAPDWYTAALEASDSQNSDNGRLLERRLVSLSNDLRFSESWSAVLPDEMLNGWLASDLPEKLPEALPDSIRNPRLRIDGEKLLLVFQSQATVVQVTLGIRATSTPNQIAFKVVRVRSGWIPIPISWWAESLTESLQRKDVLLEWSEQDGAPIALLTLPNSVTTDETRQSFLKAAQLQGNALAIAGTTSRNEPTHSTQRPTFQR